MEKILIVDDQEELLRGLAVNFRREGYEVLTATSGEAAVGLAPREAPDLILLEVMMPGMSGFGVCRELRRRGIEAPIIMLTARGEEIDRVVGLEVGADEIDFEKFRAARGGLALEMSAKEFDLLGLLVRRRGEVLTRDEILKQVWGYDDPPATRTVDTHILKLRQKVEDDPGNPVHILTVYGEGYRFVE
jgi:DNA-binding response OmpR family regulator